MEKRDLYDSLKNLTGEYIYAKDEIPENRYILIVVIFIQNSKGDFLLQKRSDAKGGKWASTGGHPKMGESSYEGICTEVAEEIGLDITSYKKNIHLFESKHNNNSFCDLYYLNTDIDISGLKKQDEEVTDIKWFTQSEIEELIKNDEMHKTHVKMYRDCIDYLNMTNK